MDKNELLETLKYYLEQLENAEAEAKDANMATEEVVAIIRKNLIEDLTK